MKSVSVPVIYEDNHLLVVEKPVNVPVQADSSGDPDMLTLLKAYIGEKYNKQGNVYLGLVHRLDRPVGGVMIFARTSKAASRMAEFFRRNEVGKTYHAVVCTGAKRPPGRGTLVHWLQKNTATNTVRAFDHPHDTAKKAVLDYQMLSFDPGRQRALMKIHLHTGRAHQIRVQFAASGMPLWGDQRYNPDKAVPGQQIALHATVLHFQHPVKKEPMEFSLELPHKEPWIFL